MKAWIIDIKCNGSSKDPQLSGGHAILCAMARSADEAELMARSLVMSHSLLVEQVLSVKLKKSQQALESSTTETILHRNALLRNPPCAMIFSVHKKGIASREIHLSPDPASDHLKQ